MTDRTDERIWLATAVWAGITTVLIVVTLTLDPLWSYYGSWAAGFMTGFSAIRVEYSKIKRQIRDSEDEALLLEVRQADSKTRNKRLHTDVDPGGSRLRPGGDDTDHQ